MMYQRAKGLVWGESGHWPATAKLPSLTQGGTLSPQQHPTRDGPDVALNKFKLGVSNETKPVQRAAHLLHLLVGGR